MYVKKDTIVKINTLEISNNIDCQVIIFTALQ